MGSPRLAPQGKTVCSGAVLWGRAIFPRRTPLSLQPNGDADWWTDKVALPLLLLVLLALLSCCR